MPLVAAEDWSPQGVADLEPRAWEALRENFRSVSVTAGAGAGKTEFLAQKAAFLLQTGLCRAPKRILAISFKCDAARNLAERVDKRCSSGQARRFDSYTFDAFTKSFLDRFRLAIPGALSPPADYCIEFPTARDYRDFLTDRGFHGVNATELESAIARTPLPLDEKSGQFLKAFWHHQYNRKHGVRLTFPMINRLVHLLLRENPDIRRALLTCPRVVNQSLS